MGAASTIQALAAALTVAAQAPGVSAPPARSAPPTSGQPTEVEGVVVTAPGSEEAIRNFVATVADPVRGERQLARWDRSICTGVAGMHRRYAEFLNDRIARAAIRVGLEAGEPGCRANVMIFLTGDSDALARDVVENQRSLVSYWGFQGNTQGRAALANFATAPRPVRWWHVSHTMTPEGQIADSSLAGTMNFGGSPESDSSSMLQSITANVVQVRYLGRLRRTTRQNFSHVVIIVDANRISGLPFGAVADYVAMVALSQLDPQAPTDGYPSILNLFADRDAGRPVPTAMTDWDVAYLQGLYTARRDANNAGRQQDDIVRSMTGERRRALTH